MKCSRLKQKWMVLFLCGCLGMTACGSREIKSTETDTVQFIETQAEGTESTEEAESGESESEVESESTEEAESLETESAEQVSQKEEVPDSIEESKSDQSKDHEESKESRETKEATSRTKPDQESDNRETQRETVIEIVEPTYEVMGAIYEDISMSWADLCMLVLDCVLTTPVSYPGDPVFAAIGDPGKAEPLLITGHQTGDQAGNYYIYSFLDGQRIYQLGNYVGILYRNPEAGRFCLQVSESEFRIYEYHSNHMVWIDTLPALPEGYSVLSMQPLNVSPPITIDNLQNYITN
ncbi:MAG: hypothetical protein IJV50_08905 [Lachnospiraceae bacterium]|nr:hypothetical protein [Lachnospiraceae bacterium]